MTKNWQFPIVGIGASAGGLKALEGLLPGIPADTGMAFVIVTHLPPGRESLMPEILRRSTTMPVAEVKDGVALEPDHLYVSPPDRVVKVADGKLQLVVPAPEMHRFPIDQFLISLAEYAGEGAIAILLSGGGSDGTLGVRAIKDHGGLTFAQGSDGGSGPMQSGMPDTAIASGKVDILFWPQHPWVNRPLRHAPSTPDTGKLTVIGLVMLASTMVIYGTARKYVSG